MPNTREKLVELIDQARVVNTEYGVCISGTRHIADHLIANGVTFAEDINVPAKWISVKDRLPEVVSTHKQYRRTIKKSVRVLCVCVQKSGKTMVKEGYCEWYNDYPEPSWQIPGTIDEVTHWQYLPQPPKGE